MNNKFKFAKITIMGEPMSKYYPYATAWEVRKYHFGIWLHRAMVKGLIVAGVAGIIFTTYKIGQNNPDLSFSKEITAVVAPTAQASETMEGKVDALKEKLLDSMVDCENKTHVLVNPDDNKAGTLPIKDKVSIGDLQWKISTIQNYFYQLHKVRLTDREALMLGLDTEKARQLAIDSWINIKGSINAWSCTTEAMKQTIDDIRFLTE